MDTKLRFILSKLLLAIAVIFVAAAAPPSKVTLSDQQMAQAAATKYIGARLRDPYSAHFQFMKLVPYSGDGKQLCGTVNARNGSGVYSGMIPFELQFEGSLPDRVTHGMIITDGDLAAIEVVMQDCNGLYGAGWMYR